ncbi:PE-PPE domain-containing protein [Mycobacterium sp. pV006]|uniref:PE-PPE domain-containing protein n=1 Tax=Mycobacterium sp. pV006 TaxID=3238983 RepID=UPI00351B2224
MRVGRRSAVAGIVSPLAAAAIALGTATPVTAAVAPAPVPACTADAKCTALLLGGTGSGRLTEEQMRNALDGYFDDDDRFTLKNVRYPGTFDFLPSIGIGSILLAGELNRVLVEDPDAQIVIGGFSQGAAVASQLLYRLELMGANAPDKDQVRFVLVSDPYRGPNTGVTNWLAPATKYDIILVAREYDGIADVPDRWWNVLANWNASLGALYLHVSTTEVNLDDVPEENITVYEPNAKGGVITKYLVPTETLPLVRFMPWLKPYEETLKRIVDAGYSRNDAKDDEETQSLRSASRQLESGTPADEAPEQTAGAEDGTDVQPSSDGSEEPTTPVVDEQSKAGAEPTDEADENDSTDPAADLEADDETAATSTGSHRAKRGSESNSVAAIKSRLADEAKAEAKEAEKEAADEAANDDTGNTATEAAGAGESSGSDNSGSTGGSERRGSAGGAAA